MFKSNENKNCKEKEIEVWIDHSNDRIYQKL